jgi:hypothetical protein
VARNVRHLAAYISFELSERRLRADSSQTLNGREGFASGLADINYTLTKAAAVALSGPAGCVGDWGQ